MIKESMRVEMMLIRMIMVLIMRRKVWMPFLTPEHAPTIVVSPRILSVQPIVDSQRCNLFQTNALVGPNKACKVIIDGGSCRNLASKELCAKLNLSYYLIPSHTTYNG